MRHYDVKIPSLQILVATVILILFRAPNTRSTTEDNREVEVEVFEDDSVVLSRIQFDYIPVSPVGPARWNSLSPNFCSQPGQSPINIDTSRVMYGRPYRISYNNFGRINGMLENNGHSPVFKAFSRNTILRGVPGRPFDSYALVDMHMHFGRSLAGSEHTVNNQFAAGEIHLVHHNTAFRTAKDATGQIGGLAVIAILFQVGQGPGTSELDRLIMSSTGMRNIINPKARSLNTLFLPGILPASGDFYTYVGSKTTPNCAPNVRWIVLRQPVTISYLSFMVLRSLRDITGISVSQYGNNRLPQPLYGRTVEANFV